MGEVKTTGARQPNSLHDSSSTILRRSRTEDKGIFAATCFAANCPSLLPEAHHFAILRCQKQLEINLAAVQENDSVDCHPLFREYFSKELKRIGLKPDAQAKESPGINPSLALQASISEVSVTFRAAHRRLYERLCATTLDKPNATLEDLQPLYQACGPRLPGWLAAGGT